MNTNREPRPPQSAVFPLRPVLRPVLPAVLLAALAAASPLSAQAGPGGSPEVSTRGGPGAGRAPEAPSDTLPVYRLEGIRVEVLRSSVDAVRAPLAVSVQDAETLRRGTAGLFFQEALAAVPGLQVQNRFNDAQGERFTIRGFGARSQFGVRGIRVVVDGIPATLPDGQSTLDHVDLGSLGRVEVLRGSAASLWGNASGGVLRLTTSPPSDQGPGGEVLVLGGSWGQARIQAGGTAGWGGGGLRMNVNATSLDGFRELADGGTYGASRKIRFNGVLDQRLGRGRLSATVNAVGFDAENPGSLNRAVLEQGNRAANPFNVAQQTDKRAQQVQVGLRWADLEDRGLRPQVAGWLIHRNLDNRIPNAVIDLNRWAGGLRGMVGGAIPGGGIPGERLRWDAGVEMQAQFDDRLNRENRGGEVGPVTLLQDETVLAGAAFAQGTWRPIPSLDLTGSLRWDLYRLEVEDRLVDAGEPDDSGDRTLDAFTPGLGLNWAVTPGVALFGGVSSFFEIPSTTELANRPGGGGGFNPELDPSRGWSGEGGVRIHGSRRWGAEAVAFYIGTEDELIPFQVATDPDRTFFRNAGSSRRVGAEVGGWVELLPWLELRGSYTWVEAEFVDYVVDGEDLGGNRVPGVAPHQADVVLRAERGPFWTDLRTVWFDAVPVDDGNTAPPAEAYLTLDLRAGIRGVGLGPVRADLFAGVTNLTDATYVGSVVPNAFGGRFFEPGPPRGFYLGLSTAWGG